MSAGDGAKGPRLYDWAHLPCRGAAPGWRMGLLIRRNPAKPDDLAYYLTHAPEGTALARLTVPEVRRLLWRLVWDQPPGPDAVLHWSAWRRRHPQRARRAHWHRRTHDHEARL